MTPEPRASTSAPRQRPSICIVAHHAYGAISGSQSGHIGGVEHQTSLTARCLARRGYEVTLLVWNEGQPDDLIIDGVRVISICPRNEGIRGVRFLHPRWTGLNRAMRRANADVYYQNCGEHVTGQVALWCRRHRRSFVYSVASDPECDPGVPMLPRAYERAFFRYGLRHADRIIVQTRTQQRMLREGSGLDSVVLPMPCPGPDNDEYRGSPAPGATPRWVWVGRISREKRLEWLLDVAEALPAFRFHVVGPARAGDAYSEGLLARARSLRNVTVAGPVPRDQMAGVYRGAAGLICTSAYEGFPNTFLEAWSFGLPVVSTVDPDDLLRHWGLGLPGRNVAELTSALRWLAGSPDAWREISTRTRSYYISRHRVDEALSQFEDVFRAVYSDTATNAVPATGSPPSLTHEHD